MTEPSGLKYAFMWRGHLYIGIIPPNEHMKLLVHTSGDLEAEVSSMIVENGLAVIPVKLVSKTKDSATHHAKFEFVE